MKRANVELKSTWARRVLETRRNRGVIRVSSLLFWLVVLAIVGANIYWLAKENQARSSSPRAANRALAKGDLTLAESEFRSYLKHSPLDGEARLDLARLLGRKEDFAACAEELALVPEWWPSKREADFLLGEVYSRLNQARRCEAAWLRCLADRPLHPLPAAMLLGAAQGLIALYVVEERPVDAAEVVWQVKEQMPPEWLPNALIMRLRTETERIDPREAVSVLRRYVANDPSDWQAIRALARAEQAVGRTAEADEWIAEAIRLRPDDPMVWRDRLKILDRRHDRSGLITVVDMIPRSASEDTVIWQYRGMEREAMADLAGAAVALERSVVLDPYREEAHYLLAGVEQRLENSKAAEHHREVHTRLSEARQSLGRIALEYQTVFERAGAHTSEARGIAARLAELCRTLGFERDAEEWDRLGPPKLPAAGGADSRRGEEPQEKGGRPR
jgi:tetratricopeptide (TPR) repeat protein